MLGKTSKSNKHFYGMYAESTPKKTIQRPAPENIIKCRGFLAP